MSEQRHFFASRIKQIEGAAVIMSHAHFDDRGHNWRIWDRREWLARPFLPDVRWQEDAMSLSCRGTMRGFHADMDAWKLITCLSGMVHMALVDLREPKMEDRGRPRWHFPTFGPCYQVLVPPMVGACVSVKCDRTILHYKRSAWFDEQRQVVRHFDAFGIPWAPFEGPFILSDRDRAAT